MWGTLKTSSKYCPSSRFIPTCVGNSLSLIYALFQCWFIPTCVGNSPWRAGMKLIHLVHPHGCGELRLRRLTRPRPLGSSPRVWGTQRAWRGELIPSWFIPTGVGNSSQHSVNRLSCTVHPHGCGELISLHLSRIVSIGSSPRVWGTRLGNSQTMQRSRFIPTGVGNSHGYGTLLEGLVVHPHGCGELLLPRACITVANGC